MGKRKRSQDGMCIVADFFLKKGSQPIFKRFRVYFHVFLFKYLYSALLPKETKTKHHRYFTYFYFTLVLYIFLTSL